jgi:transposase InsO family protein
VSVHELRVWQALSGSRRDAASMGSVGDAYDNAMAESFFAALERELLSRGRFKTQAEAKMAVFEWIEGWYNPSSTSFLARASITAQLWACA